MLRTWLRIIMRPQLWLLLRFSGSKLLGINPLLQCSSSSLLSFKSTLTKALTKAFCFLPSYIFLLSSPCCGNTTVEINFYYLSHISYYLSPIPHLTNTNLFLSFFPECLYKMYKLYFSVLRCTNVTVFLSSYSCL